jgi:hypothetical protein
MVTTVRIWPNPDQIRNGGLEEKFLLQLVKKIVLVMNCRLIYEVKSFSPKMALTDITGIVLRDFSALF